MSNQLAREFVVQVGFGGSALLAGTAFAQGAMVWPRQGRAGRQGLGYEADTAEVDQTKLSRARRQTESPANCALVPGEARDKAGGCPLFAGKQVLRQRLVQRVRQEGLRFAPVLRPWRARHITPLVHPGARQGQFKCLRVHGIAWCAVIADARRTAVFNGSSSSSRTRHAHPGAPVLFVPLPGAPRASNSPASRCHVLPAARPPSQPQGHEWQPPQTASSVADPVSRGDRRNRPAVWPGPGGVGCCNPAHSRGWCAASRSPGLRSFALLGRGPETQIPQRARASPTTPLTDRARPSRCWHRAAA